MASPNNSELDQESVTEPDSQAIPIWHEASRQWYTMPAPSTSTRKVEVEPEAEPSQGHTDIVPDSQDEEIKPSSLSTLLTPTICALQNPLKTMTPNSTLTLQATLFPIPSDNPEMSREGLKQRVFLAAGPDSPQAPTISRRTTVSRRCRTCVHMPSSSPYRRNANIRDCVRQLLEINQELEVVERLRERLVQKQKEIMDKLQLRTEQLLQD